MAECEAPAREHAPGQRHRRQETAAPRMAIGSGLAQRGYRQEVEPVPERENGSAVYGLRIVAIQRGGQRRHRHRRHEIVTGLGAADPGAKMIEIDAGFSHKPLTTLMCQSRSCPNPFPAPYP